jgi:hypothetical protein
MEKGIQRRMNDFYFEAFTPDGETITLSLEQTSQPETPSKQRVKPVITSSSGNEKGLHQ